MIRHHLFAALLLVAVIIADADQAPKSRGVVTQQDSFVHRSCQDDADCPGLQHCSGNVCHCGPTLKRHLENPQRCVPPTLTLEFKKDLARLRFEKRLNMPRNTVRQRALQRLINEIEGSGITITKVEEPRFEKRDAGAEMVVIVTLTNPEAADEDSKHRQKRFDLGSALTDLGFTGVTTTPTDADWGGNCETDDTCILGDHLRCSNDICVCKTGYTVVDGVCYENKNLGDPCSVVEQCGSWMICNTTCQCDSSSVQFSATQCLPYRPFGQTCDQGIQCNQPNADCIGGNCVCENGYKESTTEAGVCEHIPVVTLPPDRGLYGACSVNTQCVLTPNMICNGTACVCMSGYEEGNGFLGGTCVQPVIVNTEWVYTRYSPPISASDTTFLLDANQYLIPIHLIAESYGLQINATLHEIYSSELAETVDKVKGVVSYSYINLGPASYSRRRRAAPETVNEAFAQAAEKAGFQVDDVQTHVEKELGSSCERNEDCIGHVTGGIICDHRGKCDCIDGWTKSRNTCIQI